MTLQLYHRGTKIEVRNDNLANLASDRAAFFDVLMLGEYDWLLNQLDTGDTVIDVGANVGYFSLMASAAVGNTGKVIAVEPERSNYLQLRRHLDINRCTNVITICKAIDSEAGRRVRVEPGGIVARTIRDDSGDIETTTLRELMHSLSDTEVSALKLDVEGAEVQAFSEAGIEDALSRVRRIAIEVHSFPAYRLVVEQLTRAGFQLSDVSPEIDHLKTLVERVSLDPLLVPRLYGFDFLATARRVWVEWLKARLRRPAESRFTPGVLVGFR